MNIQELALKINCKVVGNAEGDIVSVSGVEDARRGEVTVAYDKKNLELALLGDAAAVICEEKLLLENIDLVKSGNKTLLSAVNAKCSFLAAIKLFDWHVWQTPGISETAIIDKSAKIGADVSIAEHVHIGKNTVIGDRVAIYPNTYIGDDVVIGSDCCFYPNVTVYSRVTIGDRVIIQANAVIGADGHGFNPTSIGTWEHIPHIGTVIIGDDVAIGAGTTIDRATLGATVIGDGTKLDNLVMIAHNVQIGKHCMIVAQVGIAGSSIVEDNVVLGGQVGVADHVSIGRGAIVAAQSGITKKVEGGIMVSGSPFQPHKEQLKQDAYMRKLPEMHKEVKELKNKLADLEKKLDL